MTLPLTQTERRRRVRSSRTGPFPARWTRAPPMSRSSTWPWHRMLEFRAHACPLMGSFTVPPGG
eukprot:12414064-Karenia_brevis.AAC.1